MSKSKMSMCYPYGVGVSCICDSRGRIYKCFPNALDVGGGGGGGGGGDGDLMLEGELVDVDGDGMIDERDLLAMAADAAEAEARMRRGGGGRGLDERTEIILAATFLVLIVLAFIRWVRGYFFLL